MRCLVTGGCGFIGSHLVARLRALGHQVTIWDIPDVLALPPRSPELPELWHLDLGADNLSGVEILEDLGIDTVFHLAAVSRTLLAIADPRQCHAVNAGGSLRLLERVRLFQDATGRKCRVVLGSSNIVYGSPNPYKASKLAMEEYMSAYNALYGLNCIALRYSNVYGPGMRWDDPICLASLRRSKYEKGYVELTGDGEQSRHWTHVSDIVEGTILAAQSDFKGVMDLASGQYFSMNAMAQHFDCPIHYVPARPGDTLHIVQPTEFAFGMLGWRAKVKVAQGIQDVLAEVPKEVHA